MPSLLPENTLVKVLPSLDIAITNEFMRSFPLCQLIHDPRPKLDHRVLILWSMACDGGFKASAPLAVIPLTESFEHELAELNGSD